jgi:4-carboxymuconolactone decarboxylase
MYAFGEIWSRTTLDLKSRCFITLAVLATKNHQENLADFAMASLAVGVAPEDVLEALLHIGVYAGLSASQSAIQTARRTFVRCGVTSVDDVALRAPPMTREQRTAAYARVTRDLNIGRIGLGADAPLLRPLQGGAWAVPGGSLAIDDELKDINGAYGYGEIWGRPRLGYRVRSFITMAVLQTLLENDQLHFHINNALNIGITSDELHEALAQAGVYAGLSGWQHATNVARDVFLQRGIVSASTT